MPKLTVELGEPAGTEFPFDHDLVIGRDSACDVVMADRTVSRHHARVRWANNECYVVDLGSANGTFVNARRIAKPARLRDGDTIVVGSTQFRVLIEADQPPSALTSAAVTWSERHSGAGPEVTMSARRSDTSSLSLLDSGTSGSAVGRQLQFLERLGKASSRGFDLAALVEFVAAELHTLLPRAQRVGVLLTQGADCGVVLAAAQSREGRLAEYQASRALLDRVLAKQESILVADAAESSRWTLGVPIVFDDRLYGAIQIDAEGSRAKHGESDLALLTAVAAHIGLALAYERVHSQAVAREIIGHDMALARHVQEHFLPRQLPTLAGYHLAVTFDPVLEIGGDFFDVLQLSEHVIGLAVGDVCGKGIAAALYGAKVISDLRHLAVGLTEPAAILGRLNRALTDRDQNVMFVTLAFVSLQLEDGRVRIASAGQPLPIMRKSSGEVLAVGRTGNGPVGVADDSVFHQYDEDLGAGDALLLHSDGVTEALSAGGEPFGDARLFEVVRTAGPEPEDIVAQVRAAVADFTRGASQSDDITLLCLGADAQAGSGQSAA